MGSASGIALLSLEVGLPRPSLLPARPPVPKARAAPTLLKELEEQEWALLEGTSTPVTGYLKQQNSRRLVPGELCSPRERRTRLGLDSFLPIGETPGVGARATPAAPRAEGAPTGQGSTLLPWRRWSPVMPRLCWCVWGGKALLPLSPLAGIISSVSSL